MSNKRVYMTNIIQKSILLICAEYLIFSSFLAFEVSV